MSADTVGLEKWMAVGSEGTPPPFDRFSFQSCWVSIAYTLLVRKPGGGDGLVADNPTMKQVSTALHGTCKQVTDLIWLDLTMTW